MTRLNVHWSTLRRQSNLGQFRAKHMFALRRRDEVVVAAEATAPYLVYGPDSLAKEEDI